MRIPRLVLVLLCCAPVGCTTLKTPEPPRQRTLSAKQALAEIARRQYPATYRGIASLGLRLVEERAGGAHPFVPRGSFAGRAVLILRVPDALRLEPLSLFGTPLLVVVARRGEFAAYSPARNEVYAGATSERGMRRILGIPLDSRVLVRLLLGDWPAALGGAGNLRPTQEGHALETRAGVVSGVVELDRSGLHPVKIEMRTGRGTIFVRYGGFVERGGVWRPAQVEITGPGGKNRLSVSYSAEEAGADARIPDALFFLTPPRGAQTIRLGG